MENLKSVEKIRLQATLKTNKRIIPKGAIFEAPFPGDLMPDIEAGSDVIEVLQYKSFPSISTTGGLQIQSGADLSLDESGKDVENGKADGDAKGKTKVESKPKKNSDTEEKQQLEKFALELDPEVNLDRRKSLKTLRKQVTELVLQKAKDLGKDLNTEGGIEVLMKEYRDLKTAVENLDNEEI